ncbi:MAG: cadmium-translocating P-type ATPase [Alphaproteobacteria bacterium]|nr:cadmium-translocating P-type ATPase [Alphaproteobacteria bacterium]
MSAAGEPVLLAVDGMFCGSCARALQKVVERLPGVASAQVGFATEVASVWVEPEADREAVIASALRAATDLGYPARPWSPVLEVVEPPVDEGLQVRIALAGFLTMWVMVAQLAIYLGGLDAASQVLLARVAAVFATPVVFGTGDRFLLAGWRTLRAGVPGLDTLVATGAVGAWALSMARLLMGSAEVWFDSAAMLVVFLLLGRLVEGTARARGANAVRALLALTPEEATVWRDEGWRSVPAAEVVPGERVRIGPFSRIPVDGPVLEGRTAVDRQAITGESLPAEVGPGDLVEAGALTQSGSIEVQAEATVGQRRVDRIATRVRRSLDQRAESPGWGERFAEKWFGVVVMLASATFLGTLVVAGPDEAVLRALAVLVITCPCALSVAGPLVTAVVMGRAAREGILFRDGDALRRLAEVDALAFDKTGTLTWGRPRVAGVDVLEGDRDGLLRWAAQAEVGSHHPLARALEGHRGPELPGERRQIPGVGVEWDGPAGCVRVGRRPEGAPLAPDGRTEAWVTLDGRPLGRVVFEDALRPDAARTVDALGLEVAVWSGDVAGPVDRVCSELGIPGRSGCTPEDKADLARSWRLAGRTVAFVGDGVNDAPVLAEVDVGIAVTGASDTARAAAAVTLVGGGLASVHRALDLAREAALRARWNLMWALVYNGLALPLAMTGFVRPHWAAAAMAASSLTVTLSATRLGTRGMRVAERVEV